MRKAKETDIHDLYAIYSHESVSPYMGFDPCTLNEFTHLFSELESGGEFIVEETNQNVVAVCKVTRRTRRLRHSAYIGSLAVHISQQGKGLGKEFFGSIIGQLKNEGLTRLELLVAADNTKAIKLFSSFGFVIEGTHKCYFSRSDSNELFSEHTMAWIKNT